jgi:predicted Zn-dependent peptidase
MLDSKLCRFRTGDIMNRLVMATFGIILWIISCMATGINVPVHFDSLSNGLKILIVPDTNVAVVSCRLYYFVGSMYEGPGTTGLSHMYEHMMFKGTKRLNTTDFTKEKKWLKKIDSVDALIGQLNNSGVSDTSPSYKALKNEIFGYMQKEREYIKKDEIWELYAGNGGTNLNAWTADDMTAYIVTLPKNKVELFYWIESDRMQNPVLREFYSERDVVAEERRMRYDNQPVNRYEEYLNSMFYMAHPYRLPTIGWMSDIQAYTIKKLYDHIHKYYTPDNAIIILTGNIDPSGAVKNIRKYFGGIPRAAEPKQEVVTREPAPLGETRFTVRDNAEPRIDVLFHIPGYPDNDLYKLDVIENILSGRSGRLYNRLVTKDNLCTDAGASNEIRLHNGCFQMWAVLKKGSDPAAVEKILNDEISRLSSEKPTTTEMLRIKNNIRMSFTSNLKSLEGLSDRLAWFQRLGNWKDMIEYPDRIMNIKAEDIPDVTAKYLKTDCKVIGLLLPKTDFTAVKTSDSSGKGR